MESVSEDLSEAGSAFYSRPPIPLPITIPPMQMQVPQYKTVEPDTGDFTLSEGEERREAVGVTPEPSQYLQEVSLPEEQEMVTDDITPLVLDTSRRQVLYGIYVEVRPKYEKLPSTTPPPTSITKRKTTELAEAEQKIVENRIRRMIDFHTKALGKGKTVPLATEQLNSMKELLLKKKPMKHRLKEISLPAVASPESGAHSKPKNKAVLQVSTWSKHQSELDDSFQNQTYSIRKVCKERDEEMKAAYFKIISSTESFIKAETKEKLPKLAKPSPEVSTQKSL